MIGAFRRFAREHGWEAAGASVFATVVGQPFLGPKLVAGFDTVTYTVPNQVVAWDGLRNLRLAAWNPYVFGGAPHLANPQVGFFYPLKLPFVWLSPHRAVMVLTALHLVILATGMVVLLGGALRLRAPAALVGAIVMTGSGVVSFHASHFEQILTIAWGPWLLAAVESTASRRVRPTYGGVLIASSTAMMLFAGHQQPAYYLLVIAAAWTLARCVSRRSWDGLAVVGTGIVGGFGLAAIQLLPTLELVGRSVRAGGLRLESLALAPLVFHPTDAPVRLLGNVYETLGGETNAYIGVAGAFLAVVGVVCGLWRRDRRRLTVMLALVGAVALVLAMGPRTVLFRAAFRLVPGFDLFRVPARWVLLVDLAVAVLAALAVDMARERLARREAFVVTGIVASIAVALLAGPFLLPPARSTIAWLVALAVVAAALVGMPSPRWRYVAMAALLVVPAVELGIGARRLGNFTPAVTPDVLEAAGGTVTELLRRQGDRVLAVASDRPGEPLQLLATMRPNANAPERVRSLDGYDGGPWLTRRWIDAMGALSSGTFNPELVVRAQLRSPLDPALLARFGVRFVLLDATAGPPEQWVPGWKGPVATHGSAQAWENPMYAGEAFLYRRSRAARSHVGAQLRDLGPAMTTVAVLEDEGPALRCTRSCERRPARLRRPSPERLIANVEASGPAVLVVAEQWDPGWRASIDGRAAEVVPADGAFLGVRVPEGRHSVRLNYETPRIRVGAAITFLTILLLAGLFVVGRRREVLEQLDVPLSHSA